MGAFASQFNNHSAAAETVMATGSIKKPKEVKHKTVSATTNQYGMINLGSGSIVSQEDLINIFPNSGSQWICIEPYPWIRVYNQGSFTTVNNTSVSLIVVYLG